MKFYELREIFNDEEASKLLNNITNNKFNHQRITKPVSAFKTEEGSKLLIDGIIKINGDDNNKENYVVSMIENMTGTVNRQEMSFNTFKKMVDIGMIKHDKEGLGDLKQQLPVASTTLVDMFTPEQVNQLLINGFYEKKCLAVGKELNVKPVAALKHLEMNENTVIIYGFSKTRENDYNFMGCIEDLSGDEIVISRKDIPAHIVYDAIDNKKIEVNEDCKINEKLHVFREAYMRKGYLVSSQEELKEIKKEIKEYEKDLLVDSFDPDKDSIKELDKVSISGMEI